MEEFLESFFSNVERMNEDIKKASYEKLQWADDNILDSITADLMDYLLYLSSDDLYVSELTNNQNKYIENILLKLYKYNNHLKENGKQKLIFSFNILKDSYNSWFEDNEVARKIKFPISYQERGTIPLSLQQIRCFDQKYYENNGILLCAYFYNVYKELGFDFLKKTDTMNISRNNKIKSFLEYLDNLTFSQIKLSEIIYKTQERI